MKQYINYNGNFLTADNNVITSQNRAFRYGDGLFETMFAVKMRVPLMLKHYNRLVEGMNVLQYEIPEHFTYQYLNELIISLLNRNKHYMGAKVRLQVFRNDGGSYLPLDNAFSFIIETSALDRVKYQLNESKIFLGLYSEFLKHSNALSKFKTANALEYVNASIWAKENEFDDCLILNSKKNICEALASNVFVVAGNYLATPHINSGCVEGVMRNYLLEVAKQNNYETDMVSELEEDLLLRADEILLTNAVSGIRWVMGFQDRRYFFHHAENLTQLLNKSLGL